MTARQFDPLNDRLSRDLRNDLAAAFAEALAARDQTQVARVATHYRARGLAPLYETYLADRLARYQEALQRIDADGLEETIPRALVLWDLGLFFEVHEILEHEWLTAQGAEKAILQALIRAAGVYVKLAQGQPEGARKMAARAVAALQRHRALVPTGLPLDRLLAALIALDPQPPLLSAPQRST